MNKRMNRKAIVLSAIVTTIALVGIGAATLLANPPAADANPVVSNTQPLVIDQSQTLTLAQAKAEIAAYQAQLSEAYQALQQAYAQIDMLQTGQVSPVQPRSWEEREEGGTRQGHIVFERDHGDDHD